MAGSLVIDTTTRFLGKALNVSSKRQGLISSNVANIDTVGYKAKDIDFKKTLVQALDGQTTGKLVHTHPKHFRRSDSIEISETARAGELSSGTIDIDQEMARLAENNIQYRTSVELLLRKMSMLRNTITDGGR
ncbi:MAG: flagellar basal body rod protein FlgB [Pseudomonadota bacterium]